MLCYVSSLALLQSLQQDVIARTGQPIYTSLPGHFPHYLSPGVEELSPGASRNRALTSRNRADVEQTSSPALSTDVRR